MRPDVWRPPTEPSPAELAVIKAVRRTKLFVFLRLHHHELFGEPFRARLIERNLDRRLVESTVELAAATKEFGARALRAALESSPLWGAGRVEDTFNLMGHALRKVLGVIAAVQGWGRPQGPPRWRRRPGCRSSAPPA